MSASNSDRIARILMDIVPLIMRVMNAEMRDSDPSDGSLPAVGHLGLLGFLAIKPFTLSELARRSQVSSPTMSNTISVLAERGFVERVPDQADRRIVWVKITESGREALARIDQHMTHRIASLIEGLPPDKEEALINGLSVLRDIFEQSIQKDPQLRE